MDLCKKIFVFPISFLESLEQRLEKLEAKKRRINHDAELKSE